MLVASNSESVVMKVDNRQGMCNNSPAKATSSENEWRSRVSYTPSVSATLTVEVTLSLRSQSRWIWLKFRHVEGYQGAPSLFGGKKHKGFPGKFQGLGHLGRRSGLQ